jgi:hypothetical protein
VVVRPVRACVPRAQQNGRRSERKQHRPPPSGLFSTVFFQHSDAIAPLRIGGRTLRRVHTDPNIFLIDGFLTDVEIQHLDTLVTPARFAKSYTDADDGKKVVDDYRTSTFVHLGKSCDAQIRQIETRAATLVGMAPDYVEPLQVVQYSEGQKFETHHDMGTLGPENTVEQVFPPRRLVTFFIYLNSLADGAGGHTEFPLLNLKVQPVRGQALLFCNVRRNGEPDERVIHRACPVEGRHLKVGMNLWVVDQSMAGLACARSSAASKKAGLALSKSSKQQESSKKAAKKLKSVKDEAGKVRGLLARLADSDGREVEAHVKRECLQAPALPPPPLAPQAPDRNAKGDWQCRLCQRCFKTGTLVRRHVLTIKDPLHQAARKHVGNVESLISRRDETDGADRAESNRGGKAGKARLSIAPGAQKHVRDGSQYFDEAEGGSVVGLKRKVMMPGSQGRKSDKNARGKGRGSSASDVGTAGRLALTIPDVRLAGVGEQAVVKRVSLREGLRNSVATSRGGRHLKPNGSCPDVTLHPSSGGAGRVARAGRSRSVGTPGAQAGACRIGEEKDSAAETRGVQGHKVVGKTIAKPASRKRKRLFTKPVSVCCVCLRVSRIQQKQYVLRSSHGCLNVMSF